MCAHGAHDDFESLWKQQPYVCNLSSGSSKNFCFMTESQTKHDTLLFLLILAGISSDHE